MRFKRLVAGAGATVLSLVIFTATTPAAPAPRPTWQGSPQQSDSNCYKFNKAERGFMSKINAERAEQDLPKLTLDPEASRVAKVHTREMINKDQLFHTTQAQFEDRLTKWSGLGENVGFGDTVAELHQAFMDSPSHRKNILDGAFKFAGMGAVRKDGRLWITEVFEEVNNPGTTLKMPDCN